MKKIYLVIPCYNEQEVLPDTVKHLREKMETLMANGTITKESRVVFVDDGSKDNTWAIIERYHTIYPELFDGLKLSRNEGHQNALYAGLMQMRTQCDAIISMDADLQDDINAIDEMIEKFEEGNEIVYGVRSERETDTKFKRGTAHAFYKLMKLMGVELVYDHADFRLMSALALDALSQYYETNLFLRGIVPMIGYKSAKVYYKRGERKAGESKYPLKKMIGFAAEGITSLSVKPIRMITALGVILFLVSLLILLYSFIRHVTGHTVDGWTSTVFSIWAIGGLQLLAIGVIGEYIGKIYLETKDRPKYFIEKRLHNDNKNTK
ncbi:MAG: glycosyltransferase family 2 protein [Oscillospiraceae bacterium]|nr:glycosyltransferase family 2 protein [Oscillospiraceae bacterium]